MIIIKSLCAGHIILDIWCNVIVIIGIIIMKIDTIIYLMYFLNIY